MVTCGYEVAGKRDRNGRWSRWFCVLEQGHRGQHKVSAGQGTSGRSPMDTSDSEPGVSMSPRVEGEQR